MEKLLIHVQHSIDLKIVIFQDDFSDEAVQ